MSFIPRIKPRDQYLRDFFREESEDPMANLLNEGDPYDPISPERIVEMRETKSKEIPSTWESFKHYSGIGPAGQLLSKLNFDQLFPSAQEAAIKVGETIGPDPTMGGELEDQIPAGPFTGMYPSEISAGIRGFGQGVAENVLPNINLLDLAPAGRAAKYATALGNIADTEKLARSAGALQRLGKGLETTEKVSGGLQSLGSTGGVLQGVEDISEGNYARGAAQLAGGIAGTALGARSTLDNWTSPENIETAYDELGQLFPVEGMTSNILSHGRYQRPGEVEPVNPKLIERSELPFQEANRSFLENESMQDQFDVIRRMRDVFYRNAEGYTPEIGGDVTGITFDQGLRGGNLEGDIRINPELIARESPDFESYLSRLGDVTGHELVHGEKGTRPHGREIIDAAARRVARSENPSETDIELGQTQPPMPENLENYGVDLPESRTRPFEDLEGNYVPEPTNADFSFRTANEAAQNAARQPVEDLIKGYLENPNDRATLEHAYLMQRGERPRGSSYRDYYDEAVSSSEVGPVESIKAQGPESLSKNVQASFEGQPVEIIRRRGNSVTIRMPDGVEKVVGASRLREGVETKAIETPKSQYEDITSELEALEKELGGEEGMTLGERKPIRTDSQILDRIKQLKEEKGLSFKEARDLAISEPANQIIDVTPKHITEQLSDLEQELTLSPEDVSVVAEDKHIFPEYATPNKPGRPGKQGPPKPPRELLEDVGDGGKRKPPPPEDLTETGPKKPEDLADYLHEAMSFARSARSSFDIGPITRQSRSATLAHPLKALKYGKESVHAYFSPEKSAEIEKHIFNLPKFKPLMIDGKPSKSIADESGLRLIGTGFDPGAEIHGSYYAPKVPILGAGVRAAERSSQAYINLMRSNIFNQLTKNIPYDAQNKPRYEAAANAANLVTGRGHGNKLIPEQAIPLLNSVTWGIRHQLAKYQQTTKTFQSLVDPSFKRLPANVRMEYLRNAGALLGTGITALGVARLLGAEVDLDQQSPDFLSAKWGNKIWKPFGAGTVDAVRAIQVFGGRKSGNQVKKGVGVYTDMWFNPETGTGRLSPLLSGVSQAITPGEYAQMPESGLVNLLSDDPSEFWSKAIGQIEPLNITGTAEAIKDVGLYGALLGVPMSFGESVDVRTDKRFHEEKEESPRKRKKKRTGKVLSSY